MQIWEQYKVGVDMALLKVIPGPLLLNAIMFLPLVTALWYAASTLQHPTQDHTTNSKYGCASISIPKVPDFEVISSSSIEVYNYSSATASGLNFCNVTTLLTHPGAGDFVYVTTLLPLDDWNGRYVHTGGGGLTAGNIGNAEEPVSQGYATSFTDGGLTLNRTIDPGSGLWALKEPHVLNWELIKNFAYRGNHAATVMGKLVVEAFYSQKPKYSYYAGCSTGGRQGYFAAQRYPDDYDGVLADAPNFYTPQASGGLFWPAVVMANSVSPPNCVFETYQAAIILACDELDGAIDGLINEPDKCEYDTKQLIGQVVQCEDTNSSVMISADYAEVVAKTLAGPRFLDGQWMWFGVPHGASFAGLAGTATVDNVTIPAPFSSTEAWYQLFVLQEPSADVSHLSYEEFDALTRDSVRLFTEVLGTENPDLTSFRDAGRKLLTWHGLADQLLAPGGTVLYREALERNMGSSDELNDFNRIFMAPGVAHCRGGYGPQPINALSVLANWVENGEAPETLFASITSEEGVATSRNLCLYPKKLKYDGIGHVHSADSFSCE